MFSLLMSPAVGLDFHLDGLAFAFEPLSLQKKITVKLSAIIGLVDSQRIYNPYKNIINIVKNV